MSAQQFIRPKDSPCRHTHWAKSSKHRVGLPLTYRGKTKDREAPGLAQSHKDINGRLCHTSLVGASSTHSRDPHSLEALCKAWQDTAERDEVPRTLGLHPALVSSGVECHVHCQPLVGREVRMGPLCPFSTEKAWAESRRAAKMVCIVQDTQSPAEGPERAHQRFP